MEIKQVSYQLPKRSNQQGIFPNAVRTNLVQYYNPKNNRWEFKNNKGVVGMYFDFTNGSFFATSADISGVTFTNGFTVNTDQTFNGNQTVNGNETINGSLTVSGAVVATQFTSSGGVYGAGVTPLVFGGATGGSNASFYTSSSTYQYINESRFTINPSNYGNLKFYLRATYRAGASGDPANTFYMALFDIAAATQVTNSEISGTAQSTTGIGGIPTLTGSVDFKGNLTTGNREYVVGIKSGDNVHFVDLYAAFLVIST